MSIIAGAVFHASLQGDPVNEYVTFASQAPDADVGAQAGYLPVRAAARVFLFQVQQLSNRELYGRPLRDRNWFIWSRNSSAASRAARA